MKESDARNCDPSLNFFSKMKGFMCWIIATIVALAVMRLTVAPRSHRK